MLLPEFIYTLTWTFSIALLLVFFFLSAFTYFKTKRQLFGFYAVYCFLVFFYLFTKVSGTPLNHIATNPQWRDINWFIQICFYSCYYFFGTRFLDLHISNPRLTRFISGYVLVVMLISVSIILAGLLTQGRYLRYFYTLVFIPAHILVALSIIIAAIRNKNQYTIYFLSGSILFILLAVFAFVGNNYAFLQPFGIDSLVWFFLAIIIESSIFSYAMGLMIWNVYMKQQMVATELQKALVTIEKKAEEEKVLREKEKQLLQTQVVKEQLATKVAFLQNKVLLEQINAHFIFNVLNSIKVFVAENQSDKAIFYLNRFAKFIRSVLDGSRSNRTTLSDEIRNMEIYLDIEKMRFEGKFDYRFHIAEEVAPEKIHLPTFILQPFIENALWHGIMPSMKDGMLMINIFQSENETVIEIEDNGIGIYQSEKNKKFKSHQSMGINIVREIIDHYNQEHSKHISFKLIDKADQENETGTKVVITID